MTYYAFPQDNSKPEIFYDIRNSFFINVEEGSSKRVLAIQVIDKKSIKNGFYFLGILRKTYKLSHKELTETNDIAGYVNSFVLEFGERNSFSNYFSSNSDKINNGFSAGYKKFIKDMNINFVGKRNNNQTDFVGLWFDGLTANNAKINNVLEKYYEINFSHIKKNEIWPFAERTFEVISVNKNLIVIKSNTTLWRHIYITGGEITNAMKFDENNYLIAPYMEIRIKPSVKIESISIKADWNLSGQVALLNAFDVIFSFLSGTRLPKDLIDIDKKASLYLMENISGADIVGKTGNVFFEFDEFAKKMQNSGISDIDRVASFSALVKAFVESAGNKELYSIYQILGEKVGIHITAEKLNLLIEQLNFAAKLLNAGSFAFDERRTPLLESVSIKFYK